jgi:ribosomal protein S6--L-glutamate ligase
MDKKKPSQPEANQQLHIVGSEEWCALPLLKLPALKARVDSGAKTSALHAFNIRTSKRQGVTWVTFDVHPLQDDMKTVVTCSAKVKGRRTVKSSSGISERRHVIETPVQLGDMSWDIEITLTNRDAMGYRMLLGREAMEGRLLINPGQELALGAEGFVNPRSLYQEEVPDRTGLKIALLASNPELYSNRRLMEAGKQAGHEMVFVNVQNCHMVIEKGNPKLYNRYGDSLEDIDAVIPRIRPSLTFYGCAVIRQFQSLGKPVQNSAKAIASARDKLLSLQLLVAKGLPIPQTGFANSPLDTEDVIESVGGAPVVVKLLEGTQGKGVVLAETKQAAESVVNAFKSLKANILVQEFVKYANGSDLRLFVIGGKVVAAMRRTAPPGEFRANVHLGASVDIVKTSAVERRIAIKAARELGLDVAGVDIIRAGSGSQILEVNSSPGLEGIESATGIDVAGAMIENIEAMIARKRRTSRKRSK